MLHPCMDYHRGVIHAPHDWTLGDTPVECPGKFDDGGTSALRERLSKRGSTNTSLVRTNKK